MCLHQATNGPLVAQSTRGCYISKIVQVKYVECTRYVMNKNNGYSIYVFYQLPLLHMFFSQRLLFIPFQRLLRHHTPTTTATPSSQTSVFSTTVDFFVFATTVALTLISTVTPSIFFPQPLLSAYVFSTTGAFS